MDRGELLKIHRLTCRQARRLMDIKSAGYAPEDNPFANFTRVEAFGLTKTETSILCRIVDKVSRLVSVSKGSRRTIDGFDKGETLEDACLDLINYVILFWAWRNNGK